MSPPLVLAIPRLPLLTGGRAFRDRRCQRRRVDIDGAGHQRGRQVVVRDRHAPPAVTGREADGAELVAGRDAKVDRTRGGRRGARHSRAVLDRVGEVRLFGGHHVPKVRLHGGDVRLRLRVGELRDRDGGQNPDDHHHDQQLDERETLAVHLTLLPLKSILKRDFPLTDEASPGTDGASPVPYVTKIGLTYFIVTGCSDWSDVVESRRQSFNSGFLQGPGPRATVWNRHKTKRRGGPRRS